MYLVPETASIELLDMDSAIEKEANREFLIRNLRVGVVPPH